VDREEDLSVPKEFEDYSVRLFEKDSLSERDFVDFCLLAINLVDTNWNKRHGMAYHIVGAWLKYENIGKDALLDQISAEFGLLETADDVTFKNEKNVRKAWDKLKQLVKEADSRFPNE
jgi:hypothetical protein